MAWPPGLVVFCSTTPRRPSLLLLRDQFPAYYCRNWVELFSRLHVSIRARAWRAIELLDLEEAARWVSIRARAWRAMFSTCRKSKRRKVSIRARAWRAMPPAVLGIRLIGTVSIRARAWRAMIGLCSSGSAGIQFQSAPARGGRSPIEDAGRLGRRFNPRPRVAGDGHPALRLPPAPRFQSAPARGGRS